MKFLPSNRFRNPLLILVSITAIAIITALSIQLLSGAYQFIETALQTSSRQAGPYFTQLAYRH